MKVGISISLYNKFEDLGILLDIIRENWEDRYYVSVCSNHPNAEERVEKYRSKIDYFKKGHDIKYYPDKGGILDNKKYRIHNSILTACRGALSGPGVSHVFHVHTDAWQLSEKSLRSLINEMNENNASAAFKVNPSKFARRYPPGSLPDQLWMIDAKDAESANFFDSKALDFPPSDSVHYMWPMLFLAHFGLGRLYQYSDRSEETLWNGTSAQGNIARPMFYNSKYGQVHIATEDFEGSLGKSLQAYYLKKYNLNKGKNISNFVDKYQIKKGDLFKRLSRWIGGLNENLKWYGLSVNDFDHDMRKIRPFIDEKTAIEKWKYAIKEETKDTVVGKILEGVYSLFKTSADREMPVPQRTQTLEDYYRSVLQREDFPEESLGKSTVLSGKNNKK